MNNLTEILRNVKTLKSIIGETKSMTPDLIGLLSMLKGKNGNNIVGMINSFANSPYLILGVTKDDPHELIDAVYKLKAKYYHPDNKQTGNSEKFMKIKNAYDKIG